MNIEKKDIFIKRLEREGHRDFLMDLTQKAVSRILEFDPQIEKMYLFGSLAREIQACEGDYTGFNISSDADIAVKPSVSIKEAENYYGYRNNLKKFLQDKSINVTPQQKADDPPKYVDVIVISDFLPYSHIDFKNGIILYEK